MLLKMGESTYDAYADARYTEEISTLMQVPDRIMVSGPSTPLHSSPDHVVSQNGLKYNDLGMRQRDPRIDMQVPDRILVAGGNTHIFSKSTPRELQLENAMMPPTMEHVRVCTPPRSIRLDEHSFPTATDDEEGGSSSTPTYGIAGDRFKKGGGRFVRRRSSSGDNTTADVSESNFKHESSGNASPLALLSDVRDNLNLTPLEEIQMLRRQMAKLNHRLMAVELENQNQQHREMILTVLVSVYFVAKVVMWVNRTL